MADKKISALTAATTPLAGTEVLPIVQGGSTVKVAVSNLTAGRAIAANGLTSSANIRTEYASAGNVTTITSNTSSGAGAAAQLYNVNDASRALRIQYSSSGGAGGSAMTNGITTETAQIFTDGNYPIVLGTNVSAALILDTSQNAKLINNLIIGTAGKGITTGGATALGFGVNNAVDAMTIDASKNIGVGTASPAVKLHVSGTLDEVFRLTSTGSPYISWYAGVTRRGYIQAQSGSFAVASDTNIPLLLSTNSTERLRIKSTGGVRYVPLDAAPAAPDAGEVYYDNLTNKLRCYNGTTWNDLF